MFISPGFVGLCQIDDIKVRVSSFNVNAKQEVEFYNHIYGLRDKIVVGAEGSEISNVTDGQLTKGDDGSLNIQKYLWRPGTKIVSGNVSFPVTVNALQKVYNLTRSGDDFTLYFGYSCDSIQRKYEFCKINSFSFSVTAGDLVQVSFDVMGLSVEEGYYLFDTTFQDAQKLVPWSAVSVSTISEDALQSFNFNVSNNCLPIYTAGQNAENLFPKKIRVGMQELTGSLVAYQYGNDLEFLD